MAAIPVESSIKVAEPNFAIRIEVSTIKQKPKRLEDVLRMCGDLFSTAITSFLLNKITLRAQFKKVWPLTVGYLVKHYGTESNF